MKGQAKRKMKILEVAADAPPYKGGISRLVSILSTGLKKRGHVVQIISPKIRLKEFKFSTIPFHRWNDYDLIHLHGPTPFLSDLMLVHSKVPIVYTHHAEICWISNSISKIYRKVHSFLARKAQAVVVHSYDYRLLFKNLPNVWVVRPPASFLPPKGLDMRSKEGPFTVLYVGQFRPFKGINVFIKAAKLLKNVNFFLVGDGYLKPKFMRMSKDLLNVKFFGNLDDNKLIDLYKRAHVICLPSINTTEAYGLVLIEGALFGCVPIASNLPGVRENIYLLKGLLFEPKSHYSLAQKISMLCRNRKLWAELSERSYVAAVNYANTFTLDYYVDNHERIFQKCLSTSNSFPTIGGVKKCK